jgi:leader peptidase (prepilin peptidase)/N-methyltransferase
VHDLLAWLESSMLGHAMRNSGVWSYGVVNLAHILGVSALFGAVAGYMLLWLVYWGFRLLAGKEGMGYGDFKLLAALGAWTGWQVLPFIVLVSAGTGAVIGGLLLWRSTSGTDTRIPFGPYLALGGLAGLVWGRAAVVAWIGHFPA